MRVLLADPPARGTRIDDSYSNLGLLYLAGALKQAFGSRDLDVRYVGARHDLRSHLAMVQEFRPQIYAISFATKAAQVAYDTCHAIRSLLPDTTIVAGGAHPTVLPLDVFEKAPVDVVGIGEGERTFTEIVQIVAGSVKPDFEPVRGAVFRRNGEVRQNELRPLVEDIDTIAFPAWDMIDFHDYPGMHLKKQPIETSMLISRGCPFRCTFCSQPVWKLAKPWLRARSPANVCEEIELLYDRGVREIYLTSDELNFREDWAVELCEAIGSLRHTDLYFQCNLRADKVTPRLAEALAAMRCWLVHLGIESANDRVLQGIGKKITVGQIEHTARLLSAAGVKVFGFMMLYQAWEEDGSLNWETSEEVDNSLRFMSRMFKAGYIHYMSWQCATPIPGAPLHDIAMRYGLYRATPEEIWQKYGEHTPVLKLPGISERAMRWKVRKGILMKDWFMLRSGALDKRHLWRAWENLRALLR